MREVQRIQWIIILHREKCGKHYMSLLDIHTSGTKEEKKEVKKTHIYIYIYKKEVRTATKWWFIWQNEVDMFSRFDQGGSLCRNSKMIIQKKAEAKPSLNSRTSSGTYVQQKPYSAKKCNDCLYSLAKWMLSCWCEDGGGKKVTWTELKLVKIQLWEEWKRGENTDL